tara:strand:- start:322 stop:477 length:156 start_codon:yes stop_codon:yes gene_type:complete
VDSWRAFACTTGKHPNFSLYFIHLNDETLAAAEDKQATAFERSKPDLCRLH